YCQGYDLENNWQWHLFGSRGSSQLTTELRSDYQVVSRTGD
ncbi:hypothetical protein TNIN_255461, partial [Trichonephila inaurata madagascariensis]